MALETTVVLPEPGALRQIHAPHNHGPLAPFERCPRTGQPCDCAVVCALEVAVCPAGEE